MKEKSWKGFISFETVEDAFRAEKKFNKTKIELQQEIELEL